MSGLPSTSRQRSGNDNRGEPSLSQASLFAINLAQAQASATPAPVPEAMPFDIPYGVPVGVDAAQKRIMAAVAEAKWHNWKMATSVVDPAGDLVAHVTMDGKLIGAIGASGGIFTQDAVTARAGLDALSMK